MSHLQSFAKEFRVLGSGVGGGPLDFSVNQSPFVLDLDSTGHLGLQIFGLTIQY